MYVILRYSSTETCIEEDDEPKPPKSISIFFDSSCVLSSIFTLPSLAFLPLLRMWFFNFMPGFGATVGVGFAGAAVGAGFAGAAVGAGFAGAAFFWILTLQTKRIPFT